MQTSELPKVIEQVKRDINKILVDFNKSTGLDIAEVEAQAIIQKSLDGKDHAVSYDVAVGINL
jgi:hypothetical protein